MPSTNAAELPKNVRDELHMTAAFHCYSNLQQRKGQKTCDLYNIMYELYHGKAPSKPSHISLLCNASYCFKDLFDESTDVVVDKSASQSKETVYKYTLKPNLHRNPTRTFLAGVDIISTDLERHS